MIQKEVTAIPPEQVMSPTPRMENPPKSPPVIKSQMEISLSQPKVAATKSSPTVSNNHPLRPAESNLQRARRERIIPIMLEAEENYSEPEVPRKVETNTSTSSVMSGGSRDQQVKSVDHIRKSRRERIIPIAIEGGGVITPSTSDSGSRPFQRRQGSRYSPPMTHF